MDFWDIIALIVKVLITVGLVGLFGLIIWVVVDSERSYENDPGTGY